ncbi:MAG: pyruvate dehydrogenase [Planctomycetes bacterium]|nr:pyruvate dehydrogenase [Planctomycetota bacterium]MCB9905378.1 pyruvate dehydrogenase [Planctomycetota bacterium]
MSAQHTVPVDLLQSICDRAFAQTIAMIYAANSRKDKRRGDPKVGGHPASCASSLHILGVLHLVARNAHDFYCAKPHAAPLDHAIHHLLRVFRDSADGRWLSDDEAKGAMKALRKFKDAETPYVFQSYHAEADPDSFHILPSGSVGIPPVVSIYLALAHRYARDHGWDVPPKAHFWSLIGDSEFREGSLLEALPDAAERQLGNVTWIIDYNRQNLDGTRIPNSKGVVGRDCDRIEQTARANGWDVVHLRHGAFREELFARDGGDALRKLFEEVLSDYEYQMLLLKRDAGEIRRHAKKELPEVGKLLDSLSDEDVLHAFRDLGGHSIQRLLETYEYCRQDPDVPTLVIAHTIKGRGLECEADPANHGILPGKQEVEALLASHGLSLEDPFAHFANDTDEAAFLERRGKEYRDCLEEHLRSRAKNRAAVKAAVEADGGLPETIGVDMSLFPVAHTQWMWGQLAAKLVRIGTRPDQAAAENFDLKELSETEKRWKSAAEFMLTLSPDVGTTTNISPAMDNRIYGPDSEGLASELDIKVKHPELVATDQAWTRHIRFEIAEANCMSAVGAFGMMSHYVGLPFFPVMTVYDFFIKRALDQLYYNLYWNSEFVILGTPSGVTLSAEGAQHSWKSDIQIPNLITWEPLFAIEVDWILSDAVRRQMEHDNAGRRGVLVRAVTRGVEQKLLMTLVRRQAASKQAGSVNAPLCLAGEQLDGAVDESTLPLRSDSDLLAKLRDDCLEGAYRLIDWSGYAGYEPGENVVKIFAMGSVGTEAITASEELMQRGIFADVIVISSPELLLGILGEQNDYRHLREGLGVHGDLCAVAGAGESEAGLISVAGRRVPIVAVCDGEAGLVDNIGSIVGVKQRTLAVRRFSKCGRPDQIFGYQSIDADAIIQACGQVLSETALEDLRVSPALLERLAGRERQVRDWRELWPANEA